MTDEEYMQMAIIEAKKSLESEDVPVGSIIVLDGQVIARAYNQKEKNKVATHHSEILAIEQASKRIGSYRLDNATIYTTKEPCLMCMGAILSARISRIVYGANDRRFGTRDLAKNNNFNHKCDITTGVCREECEELLSNFFKNLR